jgi:DUF971 family protein
MPDSTLIYVMARRTMPIPIQVAEDPSARELRIGWSDGHESRYPFRLLRLHCPCAMCVHEWTGQQLLDPSRVSPEIYPKETARVGAYALRFTWSDGHTTGIYTFPLLRSLCQCETCAGAGGPATAGPKSNRT